MTAFRPTRRTLTRLLVGWTALFGVPPRALPDPLDRGIGGTGAAPDEPNDRGIGGTGVVGTIRGFGSIVVNDQHIAVADDAAVTVDARPATAGALRLGHVIRVLAREADQGLATRRIAVMHELVGAIQHVGSGFLVVLGQTVVTDSRPGSHVWRVGDRIAVSGLRRPDGVIVASLIEPSRSRQDRIAGRVERRADGSLVIGRLIVTRVSDGLIGQRAVLIGRPHRGRFIASSARSELSDLIGLAANSYSIESLLERKGTSIDSDAEYVADAAQALESLPEDTVVRAVVTAHSTPSGGLRVDAIRVAGSPGHGNGETGVQPRGPVPGPPGKQPPGSPPGGGMHGVGPGGAQPGGAGGPTGPGGGPAPGGAGNPAGSPARGEAPGPPR